ncbi:MAG: sodium:solute symporter family protein [Vicinamibacterales bacterium]
MNLPLILLSGYSVLVVALGLWSARLVRSSSDFFVAGRSLGPGLMFTSMIAANIGAGATVGVAGLAYRDGLSAWWWSGSAGFGSLVLAFWVGPRLWRLARDRGFYTTGDFLEARYGSTVRGVVTALIWLGSLSILAAQLLAGATILNVIAGVPRWAGSLIGGAIMTAYFTAGGLLGSARVNTLQFGVMILGFAVALPSILGQAGGVGGLLNSPDLPAGFGSLFHSSGPGSGWTLLLLVGPAFIVSPGLIQKSYGAASARALQIGVGLNAIALMVFTFAPVLLGMSARVLEPGLTDTNAVLPQLLTNHLTPWLGAIALAAIFSTEVDTCDAVLFMLSTSLSQDLYKRHINPEASDKRLLAVARGAAVAGGAAGVAFSVYLPTVVEGLSIFYSLLGVTLLVPVVGGLFIKGAGSREALTSIIAGVGTWLVVRYGLRGISAWLDPTLLGLAAAALGFGVALALPGSRQVQSTGTS